MKKIGYMGIEGSFSEEAAKTFLRRLEERQQQAGEETEAAELVPLVSAKNILTALRDGVIDWGVVGVSNTLAGPVLEFHEAFDGVPCTVLDQCALPVHHCLYRKAGANRGALTEVASHIHALKQTVRTRKEKYPGLRETEAEDTALAARELAEGKLPETTAVICSREAGELWGLVLLEENIEDSEDNRTSFSLISLQ